MILKASRKWPRFSRYQIKDNIIRPAHDATLTWFDPWDAWDEFKEKSEAVKVRKLFAQSLVELCRELTVCRSGLFAPWDPENEFKGVSDYPEHWVKPENFSDRQKQHLLDWVNQHGLLDPRIPKRAIPPPQRTLSTRSAEKRRIMILREAEEPVLDFTKRALGITLAIEALVDQKARGGKSNEMRWYHRIQCASLQELASGVQPTVAIRADGKLKLEWTAPSLLSMIAMITILELSAGDGQYMGFCKQCNSAFVSSDRRGLYCCRKCKRTVNQQTFRDRAKGNAKENPQNV